MKPLRFPPLRFFVFALLLAPSIRDPGFSSPVVSASEEVHLASPIGVERNIVDGILTETFFFREKVSAQDASVPERSTVALRFMGPRVRVPRDPKTLVVLEDFENDLVGWKREGLPPSVWTDSRRCDFRQQGQRFIGTCEDGAGGYDDGYTGRMTSPPFVFPHRYLSFLIGGGRKPQTAYVSIHDAETDKELARFTGQDSEQFSRVTADLPEQVGKPIRIRIVDTDRGPWGHINADCFVSHAEPYETDLLHPKWEIVESSEPGTLRARARAEGFEIERTLHPMPDGLVHVRESMRAIESLALLSYEDVYEFPHSDPDFVWSQSIKRNPIDLIPHWQFKSPTVMFQKGPLLAALVPDVSGLTAESLRAAPTALDLENRAGDTPSLHYGLVETYLTSHSIYGRSDRPVVLGQGDTVALDHWILLRDGQPPREGFRGVLRFLWDRFGRPALLGTPEAQQSHIDPELALFDAWRREAWYRNTEEYYREFDLNDKRVGTLVSRWVGFFLPGNPDDAMFNAWFQTLRSAYGWHLHARRENNEEHRRRARSIVALALEAPRKEGAFPISFWRDDDGQPHWVNDSPGAGFPSFYHAFDMAWTGTWLLRWREEWPEMASPLLEAATALGEFLVARQRPDGYIPSWFHGETLMPKEEFAEFSAEIAGAGLFLAELARATGKPQYRRAAIEAMRFVEQQVLPRHRWLDFEVFLSCSPKPFDTYDSYTRQHPQNNLCQIQAVMAWHSLHEITGDPRFLELGTHALDYLLLTQQVFNHPLQTPPTIGGVTPQNTDAEWSDARQAYVADALFDYYEATGTLEYLERAVAAMRATFAVAPFENWSHCGYEDWPGAMTGFHWGTGSAMTTVEMARDRYRDVYVHLERGHGIALNGATLRNLAITDDTIAFALETPFRWDTSPVLVVRGAARPMRIQVNGRKGGPYAPEALARGVALPDGLFNERQTKGEPNITK